MDFKKFGLVILILGVAILGFGAIQFASNQPKEFSTSESKINVFGGRDDLGNMLKTQHTNNVREHKRGKATNTMIAGAVVLFIGGGVHFSAKTKIPVTEK
ncbi:MAG: hypothetical protein WC271_06310 [Bacteroidales bacterium]|jgi:hypothetical protein|nr:hypothetical protein [Tenuifilaceae bacterium]